MKKRIAAAICTAIMTFSVSSNAADLSGWAVDTYKQASSAGLISYNIASGNLSDSITREEFCSLTVNLYEKLTGEDAIIPDIFPFDDTDSIDAAKAYKLGIVSGDEKGDFCPDKLITRQEISKMLVNTLSLYGVDLTVSDAEIKKISSYDDYKNVSGWAEESVAKALKYGIMNGTSETTIDPLGNATREQAIAMSTRSYSSFAHSQIKEKTPEIITPKQNEAFSDKVKITWRTVADADGYYVIIKNSSAVPVYSKISNGNTAVISKKDIAKSDLYTITIGAKTSSGEYFSLPVDFSFKEDKPQPTATPEPTATPTPKPTSTPNFGYTVIYTMPDGTKIEKTYTSKEEIPKSDKEILQMLYGMSASSSSKTSSSSSPMFGASSSELVNEEEDTPEQKEFKRLWNYALTSKTPQYVPIEEKEMRVFPEGKRFESAEDAAPYMTEVEIPVWLIKNGAKVSSTQKLTVNAALAEDVKAIFNEIYALPMQYPIKSIGGYCWRNTSGGRLSQHSYGTCIDINPNENCYVSSGGVVYSGSYWKPGEDPYSIDVNDGIIEIFAKYGWAWGGNAWSSSHDYMHFTYLGN